MGVQPKIAEFVRLRPFQQSDLATFVDFWNNAFADRRNFYPISTTDFQKRVLDCPAFDPDGLVLAWHGDKAGGERLVGMVHAFRPAPPYGLYLRWEQRHDLALLYVDPAYRRQGIGTRLLRAAENWLYYCPVYVGGPAQPCYGTVEGPQAPFFGSSQQLGISVHDRTLINFLAKRGYHIVEAGDVSMELTLGAPPRPVSPDLSALGLRLAQASHTQPFVGEEAAGRAEYTLYGDNGGAPYYADLLVDGAGMLQAQISWYPMRHRNDAAAIAGFWVAPVLRGRGLGRFLLDHTLYTLAHGTSPEEDDLLSSKRYRTVEVETHWVKHARAAELYTRRGFEAQAAWVNMAKECAVRGVDVAV
jgi:GNAT superfamily N-acetyltransferase